MQKNKWEPPTDEELNRWRNQMIQDRFKSENDKTGAGVGFFFLFIIFGLGTFYLPDGEIKQVFWAICGLGFVIFYFGMRSGGSNNNPMGH